MSGSSFHDSDKQSVGPKPNTDAPPPMINPPPMTTSNPPPLLSVPRDPAEPPPPPIASGASSQAAAMSQEIFKRVFHGLQIAWSEIQATAKAMYLQTLRLVAFGRSNYESSQLARQAHAAQEDLGQRLAAAGLGDAALRDQLAQLAERRSSVEAAKGPTRVLDDERRGVLLRLAEPFVSAAKPPSGLEAEYAKAVELRRQIEAANQQQLKQRAGLLPSEQGDLYRVAAGFATLAVMLVLLAGVAYSWRGSGRQTARRPQPRIDKPGDDVLTIQPVVVPAPTTPITPPKKPVDNATAARPVKKEIWVEEDAYFPRRKAIATFVGDQPHGECKCYDEKNRLICVEQYKNGVLHGKRVSYYPSGKKFNEVTFVEGKATGTSTNYFEDGTVSTKIDVVQGIPHGDNINFFPNGNKCVASKYVNGVPHGQRLHYLPDGQCFGVTDWENGQKVGERLVLDVRQSDLAAIQEVERHSTLLKDWWR